MISTRIDEYTIHNLAEIHQNLVTAKNRLKQTIQSFDLSSIDKQNSKYFSVVGKGTIDTIIQSLPNQSQLKQYVNQAQIQQKLQVIRNYEGPYQLIKQLKNNLQQIKPEAIDSYYLLAKHKPQHMVSALDYLEKHTKLNSWKIYQEEQKVNKLQKNSYAPRLVQKLKKIEQISRISNQNLLEQDELLVHVTLYDSHIRQKQSQFICYGKQMLTELRDKFYCMIQELESPSSNRNGFFFIQNIFYNDLRMNNQDLSQVYFKKNIKKEPQYQYISFHMQKTRIFDLRIELGKGYLFRHLNSCDHMIVFNQIHLLDINRDLRDIRSYPLLIFQKKIKRRRCQLCEQAFAKMISLYDSMKNGQNLYLCQQCHKQLHLDQHGNPLSKELQIIKYIHD